MSLHTCTPRFPKHLLTALAAAALLAACGGGKAPEAQSPELAFISGRAVDGPLAGATACYDLNDNGSCDSGEPVSEPTAADGSFRISVAPAEAGRHAVVVDVPASAVDADTGAAVGTAFTLRAPATATAGSQAVFVSPLTTLVHAHMAAAGVTREQAVALVQAQAGIGLSPLADFTQDSSSTGTQAARMARLVQLTANEQRNTLAALVGTPDRDGNPISSDTVEREVLSSLVAGLPLVAGTLTDPGLAAANGHTLQALLRVAARSLALQLDLNADAVRMASTLQRLAEPPTPAVPVATGALRYLRYTSSEDFSYRMLNASAADNVPDANGYVRYYDWNVSGTPNATTGTSVTRAGVVTPGSTVNTHWNGTAWVTRAANDRYLSGVRDSQGRQLYNFGDGLEVGTSIRRVEDISSWTLEQIVRAKIRRFPGSSGGVAFANWGPSNLSAYGTATFPTGSYLIYQTNTPTSTAISYNPATSNQVSLYSAAIALGGDVATNPASACNDTAANIEATLAPATVLEDLVTRNKGKPCVYPQSGQSLSPDEWWGNSTLSIGDLPGANTLPPGTGTTYSTTANVRVSFAASGNRVTFWRCYRRVSLNSPRNCSVLGLGTWSIQTLGDGRALGFSVAPALAQRLGFARYFVERGGRVYFATKSPVGVATTDLRLNLEAANAVFQQLGLPRIKPVTEPGTATGARAAALSTLQGTWGDANSTEAVVWRFGPNGRFFMASAKPFDSLFREQSGAELGWFDHDPTGQYFSTSVEVDSNLTSGTSHPKPAEMFQPMTITATQISGGTGADAFAFNRLPTAVAQSSVLGMWAIDSATDLSKNHIVFFGNGRFMTVTHVADTTTCAGTNQCPPGVEFGEYTYDPATGALLLFNPIYDTNGCEGVFETCTAGSNNTTGSATLTVAADGLTGTWLSSGGNSFTIYRIQPQ